MTRDPRAVMGAAILNAIIDASRTEIDGVSVGVVDPTQARQSLVVALAMVLEADPNVRTAKDMREAAELVAREVKLQLRTLRDVHERTGQRAWDAVVVQ